MRIFQNDYPSDLMRSFGSPQSTTQQQPQTAKMTQLNTTGANGSGVYVMAVPVSNSNRCGKKLHVALITHVLILIPRRPKIIHVFRPLFQNSTVGTRQRDFECPQYRDRPLDRDGLDLWGQ